MLLNDALNLPFKQSEVDFLIPNLKEDLNLYVDPFLFYKSKNPEFNEVHTLLRKFFEIAIQEITKGNKKVARRMLSFPEVKETMLGLSVGDHAGRGLGKSRGTIIYDEIISNKDIQQYGISHIAEMQLLIEGVGYDMVSDMCTNIAKSFFIRYTQAQCNMHNIPMEKGICIEHVFDWDELDWDDQHEDLPINPFNDSPFLLVPKTVLRRFEEIDYKDFWNSTYRYMLREIETEKSIKAIGKVPKITWKQINEKYNFSKKTVVEVLHEKPELKRIYLAKKEKEQTSAVSLDAVEGTDLRRNTADELKKELSQINPGNKDAKKYESLMIRILKLLFSPQLDDPHPQVKTIDGREIIDITFYNYADSGFWNDIKIKHGSNIIPIELKNMKDLNNEEFFQISSRLNEDIGLFGILISRENDGLDIQRAYRRLNREKKVIINLTDKDILTLLDNYQNGLSKTMYINQVYRKFMEEA
ncbi:hypothetical protein CN378_14490 [Bacillus sp. AFS015802]|uniref:hypothetical protein n=1 Tax=Bacillus sp. AFS015802 TaxID=2033486 RepID=UPI000BF29218|nr:hypothetical protein [Bacillus sp. AFS015802]PFA66204.1 hypothetical protein CN378_14490 [Bacillus sp. AFS015802]